jgi:succinate-acetate transporter protein
MAEQKTGNPAVVGLAGFGLSTLMLQFHNVGWVSSVGPVVWLGLICGGVAQLIAGLQEMKTGNNFGYCAFTSYGGFWIALCLMLLGNKYDLFRAETEDIGWFMIVWTIFTFILWTCSLRINSAMAFTFTTLLIGLLLLDLAHFGYPRLTAVAGYDLIICALAAWYMMARILLNELHGRETLPAGKPWLS